MSNSEDNISGQEIVEALGSKLDEIRNEIKQEIQTVNNRLDRMELRLTRIEAAQKRLHNRLYENELEVDLLKEAGK
jgi:hypothetical protein